MSVIFLPGATETRKNLLWLTVLFHLESIAGGGAQQRTWAVPAAAFYMVPDRTQGAIL